MPNTFTPTDTPNVLYIDGFGTDIETFLERVRDHFPNTDLSDLVITSEYIHTNCIGYDLYDPSDYTNYIVVTR